MYQQKGTTMLTLDQFINNYIIVNEKKGVCRIKVDFFDRWGNTSFPKAYAVYVAEVSEQMGYRTKIKAFETFLKEQGVAEVQSNISESRYYFYNGVKYRFSAHIYPTGSMTQHYEGNYTVIDFAADPQLIDTIKY